MVMHVFGVIFLHGNASYGVWKECFGVTFLNGGMAVCMCKAWHVLAWHISLQTSVYVLATDAAPL